MHIIIGAVIFGFMLYFSIAVCSAGKEADRRPYNGRIFQEDG